MGSQGSEVALLQALLLYKQFFSSIADIDADFGQRTKASLVKYQLQNGLIGTGHCNKETWKSLLGGLFYQCT